MKYKDINDQVKLYFNTLHESSQKGGEFVFFPQDYYDIINSGSVGKCINVITDMLYQYKDNSVFITLNSYKKISNKNLRNQQNLWGLDCLMIDIDGPSCLCGKEQELYDNLSWFWDNKELLPEPNLYSFTGGGGIHLYYAFNRLPKTMWKSVNKLKSLFCETIEEIQKSYDIFPTALDENDNIVTYKVDTRVIDNQRCDRIPGSINKKTGNRCVCFKNNVEKYEILDLYSYFQDKLETKHYSGQKTYNISKIQTNNKVFARLFKKRVRALFELQKNGKNFRNCRESAVFIMCNSLKQLGYDLTDIERILHSFNSKFYKPLKESELRANINQAEVYKISNAKIKSYLNLTPEEEKLFFSRKRPGNRREKTFNNKVNISKLVIKGYSISKISKILNLSQSIVKHMRVEIKKTGGFLYWSLGCDKKKYKKVLKNKISSTKPVFDRLFSAASKPVFSFDYIGSFCNVYNILFKRYLKEIIFKEINYINKEYT